jgi:ABC-type bacteriocin/lantibiotic exporter with double-glycine peptidase domain
MRRFALCLAVLLCTCPAIFAGQSSGHWLDVPFVHQQKNGCGSAVIAMIMQYWQRALGRPAGAAASEIQQVLYSPQGHGIYASDLERYLSEHGYSTFAFQGTWDDLRDQLAKGRPAIVALKVGRNDLHYVVVAGLDAEQNVIFKNDPAQRKLLKQGRGNFEKEWKAAASWILLAVPRQDAPAPLH